MEVVLNDLMIHRQARHVSCIAVNTWTRFNGTYENIFMIVVEKSYIDRGRYIRFVTTKGSIGAHTCRRNM